MDCAQNHKVKYGKVYLHDGEKYQELKSARFSNLDFKWYSHYGTVHSEYRAYLGSNYSLGFKISIPNASEVFEGQIFVPVNLGNADLTNVVEQINKGSNILLELAKRYKLITDKDDKASDFAGTAAMGAFMNPGAGEQKLWSLLILLSLMIDDFMDIPSLGMKSVLNSLSYRRMSKINQTIASKLQEKHSDYEDNFGLVFSIRKDNPSISLKTLYQVYKTFKTSACMSQGIREEALKLGTEAQARPFLTALSDCVEAEIFDKGKEWNKKPSRVFIQAQAELGKATSGAVFTVEAIALQRQNFIKDCTRNTFLFKYFQNQIASIFRKINDTLSYSKEVADKDCSRNLVYLLQLKNNWTAEKALQKVLQDANLSVEQLIITGDMLLEMYENDKQLEEYIYIAKQAVSGYIQWHSFTARYHPDLVFDCYIATTKRDDLPAESDDVEQISI